MKLNTPLLLSIIIAVIGFFSLEQLSLNVSSGLSFLFGAVSTGIIVQLFVKTAKDGAASNKEMETTTLYVGNLAYRANEASVRELFSEQGHVVSVRLMKDKFTGKRRGFGFVEMLKSDAKKTIKKLNEKEFQERLLRVREANERVVKE